MFPLKDSSAKLYWLLKNLSSQRGFVWPYISMIDCSQSSTILFRIELNLSRMAVLVIRIWWYR